MQAPGQVQQGSGEGSGEGSRKPWCKAKSGSTGFRRRFRRRSGQVQKGSGEGSGEGLGGFGAQAGQVVPEKVPQKDPGSLGAKPSQVQRVPEKVPALGFAARFRKICKNITLRLLGIPPKLIFP